MNAAVKTTNESTNNMKNMTKTQIATLRSLAAGNCYVEELAEDMGVSESCARGRAKTVAKKFRNLVTEDMDVGNICNPGLLRCIFQIEDEGDEFVEELDNSPAGTTSNEVFAALAAKEDTNTTCAKEVVYVEYDEAKIAEAGEKLAALAKSEAEKDAAEDRREAEESARGSEFPNKAARTSFIEGYIEGANEDTPKPFGATKVNAHCFVAGYNAASEDTFTLRLNGLDMWELDQVVIDEPTNDDAFAAEAAAAAKKRLIDAYQAAAAAKLEIRAARMQLNLAELAQLRKKA